MRLLWLLPIAFSTLSLAQSFTVQNSNTTEDLRGVSAVSATVVWASGTHGTYLRTTDGGATWLSRQVPGAETLDFRDVEAFSVDGAYLLAAGPGEQSRIYKTNDGGNTWDLQFTNHEPKGFYDCMAFWDRAHGIALGDPIDGQFELITTDDGGAHWNPLPTPYRPHSLAEEGAFAASGSCITVQNNTNVWFVTGGNAARVFRSNNRGNTWSAADAPVTHDSASSGVFSISFNGSNHGVIGGGDYKHPEREGPNLAYTEDGGLTWTLSQIRPEPYFSAVALDPNNGHHLLAVGSAHAAYTDDVEKGAWKASWDMNLNAVAFAGPGGAFAVGQKGKVVRFALDSQQTK
jgi:photosystem II stability/assembly factor-like uncharacterized protein